MLTSDHGLAGEQYRNAGGGVEEGHGEGDELFADLADVTELRETTVNEDLVNDLFRKVQDGDFLLVLRDKHSLVRRHHPVTIWGLGRGLSCEYGGEETSWVWGLLSA